MFLVPQISVKFEISPFFKIFDQFSYSFLKIHEFSHFNPILLSLYDV